MLLFIFKIIDIVNLFNNCIIQTFLMGSKVKQMLAKF